MLFRNKKEDAINDYLKLAEESRYEVFDRLLVEKKVDLTKNPWRMTVRDYFDISFDEMMDWIKTDNVNARVFIGPLVAYNTKRHQYWCPECKTVTLYVCSSPEVKCNQCKNLVMSVVNTSEQFL